MLPLQRKTTLRPMCRLRRPDRIQAISSCPTTLTSSRRRSAVRPPQQPTGNTAGRTHFTRAAIAPLGMCSLMMARRGFRPVSTTGGPLEDLTTICVRRWRRLRCRTYGNDSGTINNRAALTNGEYLYANAPFSREACVRLPRREVASFIPIDSIPRLSELSIGINDSQRSIKNVK
jgi:hypothetical protein